MSEDWFIGWNNAYSESTWSHSLRKVEPAQIATLQLRCVYALRKMKQSISNLVTLRLCPEEMKIYDTYTVISNGKPWQHLTKTIEYHSMKKCMDTTPDLHNQSAHCISLLHTTQQYRCRQCVDGKRYQYVIQYAEYTKQEICPHLEAFFKASVDPLRSLCANKHYVLDARLP